MHTHTHTHTYQYSLQLQAVSHVFHVTPAHKPLPSQTRLPQQRSLLPRPQISVHRTAKANLRWQKHPLSDTMPMTKVLLWHCMPGEERRHGETRLERDSHGMAFFGTCNPDKVLAGRWERWCHLGNQTQTRLAEIRHRREARGMCRGDGWLVWSRQTGSSRGTPEPKKKKKKNDWDLVNLIIANLCRSWNLWSDGNQKSQAVFFHTQCSYF